MTDQLVLPEWWPEEDRAAWQSAYRRADVFDERSKSGFWGLSSWQSFSRSYSKWLRFRIRARRHDVGVTPALVQEYLGAYSNTASRYILAQHLYAVIRALSPEHDWSWLGITVEELRRELPRRPKPGNVIAADKLYALGFELMAAAENRSAWLAQAVDFRDGLMIAFLAARPIRRKNLASLKIGEHLIRSGRAWGLYIPASEVKNNQPYETSIPPQLGRALDRYLRDYRPRFANAGTHNALWPSWSGPPLTADGVYQVVVKRTRTAFGRSVSPHGFRASVATTIALRDPAHFPADRCRVRL